MSFQCLAHLQIKGVKILVLVYGKKYSRRLKIRKSGPNGVELTDESYFLLENPEILNLLKEGKVIEL